MKEKFIFKPLVLSYFAVSIEEKTSQESFNAFLRKSFSQASDHIAHKFYNSQTPGHKHNAAMFSVTAKHQWLILYIQYNFLLSNITFLISIQDSIKMAFTTHISTNFLFMTT